ncbi:MAG: hypothetical protein LBU55_03615 [Elusimicrobiota bacterium]|jgi:predicted Fe-Mo cluster-binding NifX family protein|nr:hypothetical protein [Elusimicrobiota bacterium]
MFKRVAFASFDGIVVDSHFGMADMFYIYDVIENQSVLFEKRRFARNDSRCHNDENFEKAYQLLRDCDAVFVEKIGQSAANFLIKKNLRVFEINAQIQEILTSIIEDNNSCVVK